jgi:hypothetical protein
MAAGRAQRIKWPAPPVRPGGPCSDRALSSAAPTLDRRAMRRKAHGGRGAPATQKGRLKAAAKMLPAASALAVHTARARRPPAERGCSESLPAEPVQWPTGHALPLCSSAQQRAVCHIIPPDRRRQQDAGHLQVSMGPPPRAAAGSRRVREGAISERDMHRTAWKRRGQRPLVNGGGAPAIVPFQTTANEAMPALPPDSSGARGMATSSTLPEVVTLARAPGSCRSALPRAHSRAHSH